MRAEGGRNAAAAARVHARLSSSPELVPVAFGEGRRFALWDLASLAEGALGERVEPEALGISHERRLRGWLGANEDDYGHDDRISRRYWIRGPHGTVGTVAVETWPRGRGTLAVSSLYVRPDARRCGHAWGALRGVYDAAVAEGLRGIRLETHWTWQDAVRYYLARGFWVLSWKHALGLALLSDLPVYEVRRVGDALVFLVREGSAMVPLLVAGRGGGRLRLRRTRWYRAMEEREPHGATPFYAMTTLALHLAVRGRPLVRDEASWAQAPQWSDIGEPEGLAYKIALFEQAAREDGWRVGTPAVRRTPAPRRRYRSG